MRAEGGDGLELALAEKAVEDGLDGGKLVLLAHVLRDAHGLAVEEVLGALEVVGVVGDPSDLDRARDLDECLVDQERSHDRGLQSLDTSEPVNVATGDNVTTHDGHVWVTSPQTSVFLL